MAGQNNSTATLQLGGNGSGKALVQGGADAQSAAYGTQRHGKYYLGAYSGAAFRAALQAGVTISAALATTYTGLCLSNPAGSGKNLVVQKIKGSLNVAPAALTAIGLIAPTTYAGVTVHTTPVTIQNANQNGPNNVAAVGKVDAACTLVGTPLWTDWIAELPAATSVVAFDRDFDAELIIGPGGYIAVGASIAGPAAGLFASISWEELPL